VIITDNDCRSYPSVVVLISPVISLMGGGLIFSLYRLIFYVYGPICIISAISAATARQSRSAIDGSGLSRLMDKLYALTKRIALVYNHFLH
jgi:hypothetical protein